MKILIIFFLTVICFIEPLDGYSHCYDDNNKGMYYGTIAVTTSGKHCQPWANQSPWSHTYTNDANYPFDGGVAGANNYCRDPDFNYVPWCYTMDPTERWEVCDIPECTNLPCGVNIAAGAANPSTLTASLDSNTAINYLATAYEIPCCGTIEKWKVWVRKAGNIKLQIWRYDGATGEYILIGENAYVFNVGHENSLQERTVSAADRISVQGGDMIGWRADSDDMISYDSGAATNNLLLSTAAPTKGQSVNFGTATIHNSRNYAIGVDVAQSTDETEESFDDVVLQNDYLAPYFTNPTSTVTITDNPTLYPVGTTVFPLTVTDADPDDVTSLTVTMTTASTYFEVTSNFDIKVKSSPVPVGTYVLDFEVSDNCGDTGLFTVTITVTKEAVNINNLPDFGNVSESQTSETLVFTLAFDSSGPHTCTIDTYAPTRAEGNPFLIKLTPSSEVGVYLKASAAVRYSVTDHYNLTITCDDGSTSDTKDLTVNIDPNAAPQFQSWPGSVTISGPSTPNGYILYNATITDAESDPLTVTISSCTPTPCIFNVNNAGELSTNQDLTLHQISSYTVYLTADDGFQTVTSPSLTVTITDLNNKPVFTNLGVSHNVPENTNSGTTVFSILCTDADGDPLTFTTAYAPGACSSVFAVGLSDGHITTLAYIDYETVTATSCVLTVTANDGIMDSDPDTITLAITDSPEPPVFSSPSGYTITTPEVTGGTVLPDPGITVTDPEGTAVTLSLACATDPGYLSINSGTGLVTMVTPYVLGPTVPSYTINCDLTGTDASSQTSTVPLTVTITDENNQTPTFSQGMYTINILNTQALGVIGSAPASDDDSTSPNNNIVYTLTGSTKFTIDASGNIELIGDVTGDTGIVTYTMTATATDGGASPLAGTAVVQVLVSDTAVATTTTTTTTTTSGGTVVSGDSGFFSSALNIVWLCLAIALGTMVMMVGAYMLYHWCRNKPVAGENLSSYTEKPNNLKETPVKQDEESPVRKRSLSETSRRPSNTSRRPISGDSGINIDVRTPSPANTRYQPISVQPADDMFTADSSTVLPRTNYLNMHDIREWRLNQGQWRQALQVGRLKH